MKDQTDSDKFWLLYNQRNGRENQTFKLEGGNLEEDKNTGLRCQKICRGRQALSV